MTPVIPRAPCGDDELLFSYAQGDLGPDERRGVEAHINACADCRRVLAEALRGLADAEGQGTEGSRRRIGRYTLVELLGAGSSGVVYRAFDPELERTVALKLLRSDPANASREGRERRLREARTMAQVSDPNVVTVFDAGLSEGSVYIVMEYVEGETLQAWLRQRRTPRELVAAFLAAGRGLSALHARALVHRDFKPENVMVGDGGRIQVTDFGLARAMTAVEAGGVTGTAKSGHLTMTHGLFGTPAYMAPELFAGEAADARSDQFSFAVALLSAATGHHPFGADEHVSVSELVLRMHQDRRELAAKARALPAKLREALLRALSVDPGDRFPTMPALLAELERAPVPGDKGRRNNAVLVALGVFVLGAFAFALVLGLGARSPPAPHSVSPAPQLVAPPKLVSAAPELEITATPPRAQAVAEAAPLPVPSGVTPPPRALRSRRRPPGRLPPATVSSEPRYDDRLKEPF